MIRKINSINITRGVRNLLFINILVFLIIEISTISDLKYFLFINYFSLIPFEITSSFQIWRLFTYLFLHGDFLHLLFNQLVLFFIGSQVEQFLGTRKFYVYYFVCGVGAASLVSIFHYNSINPIIGSSGAIFGLLYSLSVFRPNAKIYLYFVFPIRISTFVNFIAFSSLFAAIFMKSSQVSHITHLSGILSAHLYFYSSYYILYIKNYFLNSSSKKNSIHNNENSDNEIRWNELTQTQRKKIINSARDSQNNDMIN